MNHISKIILNLVMLTTCCFATDTSPFTAKNINIDFGQGRIATFGFQFGGLQWVKHAQSSKVSAIELTFNNGKKALINPSDFKDLDLIDLMHCELEIAGRQGGTWALKSRIKNKALKHRIADDYVVFSFRDYKYVSRSLEINESRNKKIKPNKTLHANP